MDLHAHDELWPLFYRARCQAIPVPARLLPAIPFGHMRLVGLRRLPEGGFESTRVEEIAVTRTVLTTLAALTVQDAHDAGFLNNTELTAYLRYFEPELAAETPVFLAHFVRVIEGEKV